MADRINSIKKYLSETLLFEGYSSKSKEELVNDIISSVKMIIGFCLAELICYFYSYVRTGHGENLNVVMTFTMCMISAFRILYLSHILKKL